ncbi:MAG TPA: protein kinase [Kofleriaceae bacterium]|nr:protein kinase [Kofleriaceae bacterium]
MSERAFGGYAYQQRLGTGTFGEVYRAMSAAGAEARIVHVDPRLAARPAFARALVKFGEQAVSLAHPNVVGVRQVGRNGDHLVVVTDPVSEPVALAELIDRAGGRLSSGVALAIGRGVVEGLARAHVLHIVHGAVHPRSVVVDARGTARLADFGLAGALTETALEGDETDLLDRLRGYLAPELAFGRVATTVSDVYAAGALLFELIEGAPPPGPLHASARVGEVIERALAIDPGERIMNAPELEELLRDAIAADGCQVASAEDLARLVSEHVVASDDALHAATEDLLAGLDPVPPAELEAARSNRVSDLIARLEEDSADDPGTDLTEVDPHQRSGGQSDLTRLLRPGPRGRPTGAGSVTPDPAPAPAAHAGPHAGMDEGTPLPEPVPHRPGSVTRHLDALEAEDREIRRQQRRASRDLLVADEEEQLHIAPRRSRTLLWVGITAFAVAALGAVIYTQTDLFNPGRRQAEEREAEAARQAEIARHLAAQPNPADITVTAGEPDAAVWLLLGRTPLESMPLSAGMVHELRVEHEGYLPLDVRVTGYQWKEQSGGALGADVVAELVQGAPRRPVPAYPAATAASGEAPAGPRGRGVVRVKSAPPGAQVWLLIGFTPRATISGVEAGREYELKVLKDGFRPGSAAVRASDWFLSGRGGPMLASMTRDVTLAPTEPRAGKPGKPVKARKQRGRRNRANSRK